MPSSDDLLAGGPPADDSYSDTPYLGVPQGYQFPNRQRTMRMPLGWGGERKIGRGFEPYVKGDEFTPSQLAAEDRARIQYAMREAGVFTKNERFQLGVWDATTRGAYKRLLEYSNGAGVEWRTALNEFAAAKQQMGDTVGDGRERAPLAVRVSNPMELRKAIDVGIRTETGRRADAATLDRIVAAYQAEERRSQTEAYNAAETGGTVTDAPDLETFVENQAETVNPQGAFRQQAIGVFAELGQILGGGAPGGSTE